MIINNIKFDFSKSKCINCDKKLIAFFTIIIMYLIADIYLVGVHEAWRDEAQAWVIAKNLSVGEIFKDLANEGHPILWFLVLKALTMCGLKFAYLGYVTTAIMAVTVGVIFFAAPFPYYVRIIIVFSPICVYYNAVISRCYCLVALVTVLVAAVRKNLEKYSFIYALLIAVLFQTHILVVGLGLGLMIDYIIAAVKKHNLKWLLYSFVPISSFIFLLAELHQGDGPTFKKVTVKTIVSNISRASIISGIDSITGKLSNTSIIGSIFFIVCVLYVFLFAVFIIKKKMIKKMIPEIIIETFGLGGYLSIICFVRGADHIQIAITFLVILLFCSWLNFEKIEIKRSRIMGILLMLCLLLTYPREICDIRYDIRSNYSNSKLMSEYIINKLPEDSTIVVRQINLIPAVYSYVADERKDIKFWSADTQRDYKYHQWGMNYEDIDNIELMSMVNSKFSNKVYYLSDAENSSFRKIADANSDNYWDESYWLYRLK